MNHLFIKAAWSRFSLVSCIFAVLLVFTTVRAQTKMPNIISYQGQMTSSTGAIVNGMHHIVATLSDGELKPGSHTFDFNSSGLAAGSYFLTLVTPTVRRIERVDVEK
jgi:hypothetical protein